MTEAELKRFGLWTTKTIPTTTTTETKKELTTEKVLETTEHPLDARLAVIDLSENDIEQGKTPFDIAVEKVLNSTSIDVHRMETENKSIIEATTEKNKLPDFNPSKDILKDKPNQTLPDFPEGQINLLDLNEITYLEPQAVCGKNEELSNAVPRTVEEAKENMLLNLSRSDILVIPTTRDNSVSVLKDQQYCIPQQTQYLRFRFNYGQFFRQLYERMRILKRTVGRFMSSTSTEIIPEPDFVVKYRECDKSIKVHHVCPETSMVGLKDNVSTLLRLEIIQKLHRFEHGLNKVISRWNSLSTDFTSPDQTIPSERLKKLAEWDNTRGFDSRNILQAADPDKASSMFYLQMDQTILTNLDILQTAPFTADNLTLNVSVENFFLTMAFVNMNLDVALTTIDGLNEASTAIAHNYFPEYMFPYSHWIDQWLGVTPVQSQDLTNQHERLAMIMLTTLPITTVRIDRTCDPLATLSSIQESCYIDGAVLISKATSLKKIQEISLLAQPWKDANNK
ncbi:MAG TPA: hypothetical protein VK133_02175 [Amoebophilaceae bacterium]|nr:hypothetical protein [Amoebophilaceae bacterium]